MWKRKQKSKKTFRLRPNYALSIIFCVVGVLILFISRRGLLSVLDNGIATGIAVIISAVTLFIQEFMAYRSWKSENLLKNTILDALMFEQFDAMRNIRYNQSIELTIEKPYPCPQGDGVKMFLKMTCVHEYTYKNESLIKKNIDIDIFNDIFIPVINIQRDNPYQRIDFNCVKLKYKINSGNNKTYQNAGGSEYFKRLPDGRPHFHENISLNAGDEVTLTYSINNEFELFSRLVWNIQELSENIKIFVKNKSAYDLSKFILAINHPNRDKMHEDNKNNLSDKCCLKRKASGGDWDCEIMFDHPFLPYQGFELKWDL